jgi:hypothetical protein
MYRTMRLLGVLAGWLTLSNGTACDRLNDVLALLQGQLADSAAMEKK